MGCVASVLSRNVTNRPSDQQEHISQPTPNQHAEETTRAPRRRTPRFPDVPLNEHYNQPIRSRVWRSKRRTWTREQLDRERIEFFETRVTGRPEIWAALSTVVTLVRSGDLVLAQSIIDAAGITLPTGDLCQGCYDEHGVLYRLPQCVVNDPENMVTSSGSEDESGAVYGEDGAVALSDDKLATDDGSGDELLSQDIERCRDEKGKTSERDLISVLARLSDREGRDILISTGKSQSVGFLARKVHQKAKLKNNARVRIAYLGRLLNEQKPLLDQGWQTGHVITALVVVPADEAQDHED
ncbi:uncharacterized protein N7515_004489 [Penicillium bovifimosum]|uniref:DC-UbP/UBTD2 N-terminal domain-containing protein n=1 Tax=Penicillium bovifimosum TaxID=126998 RepID=A0A9W9L3J1_9EURO|nr:uncharacterized protein N7515_004489 [Penicillium bovifimosum]KAJ5135211.1 hypothetical protein N7515_004489 [Penicillium bovifimosum]